MGHIQDMSDKQRSGFIALCYQRKKEANKGYNFSYFNQEKWEELEKKGYQMYDGFNPRWHNDATDSLTAATEAVDKLRSEGNYARIICGYVQTIQRIKHFSVIFKNKLK